MLLLNTEGVLPSWSTPAKPLLQKVGKEEGQANFRSGKRKKALAGEMARQVKALAHKPACLNWIPRIHTIGENQFSKVVL